MSVTVTEEGGITKAVETTTLEPGTAVSDTVTAELDRVFGAVTKAWDTMFIPVPPEDFSNCNETFEYSNKMQELVQDLVTRANSMESKAQDLAAANMRQVGIIKRLRDDILRLKTRDLGTGAISAA